MYSEEYSLKNTRQKCIWVYGSNADGSPGEGGIRKIERNPTYRGGLSGHGNKTWDLYLSTSLTDSPRTRGGVRLIVADLKMCVQNGSPCISPTCVRRMEALMLPRLFLYSSFLNISP